MPSFNLGVLNSPTLSHTHIISHQIKLHYATSLTTFLHDPLCSFSHHYFTTSPATTLQLLSRLLYSFSRNFFVASLATSLLAISLCLQKKSSFSKINPIAQLFPYDFMARVFARNGCGRKSEKH